MNNLLPWQNRIPFLRAHWQDLLFANYEVDPALLQRYVPEGTRIDTFEGKAYASLVAFVFKRTSFAGVPAPGFESFAEVNLRFYITPDFDPQRRSVTFIKEIVPQSIIPLIANGLFNERYEKRTMQEQRHDNKFSYQWSHHEDHTKMHSFSAEVKDHLSFPKQGSLNEFITEHYWGYAQDFPWCSAQAIEYRVEHPQWLCSELSDYNIAVDFAECYGDEFAILSEVKPASVIYAQGSDVSVSLPRRVLAA